MGDTARLGDDALELIDLGLGTAESTEPLLGELTGALVLGVTQQLNNATLVWGEAGDLADDVPHKRSALGDLALERRDAGLGNTGGGFVALVDADGKAGAGRLLLRHC